MLAPRPLAVRLAAAVLAAALLLGAVSLALRRHAGETFLLRHQPVTYNLAYGPQFKRVDRPGTLLALAHDRRGLFLDSYVLRDLQLPAYKGAVGGMLPVYADRYIMALRRRYNGFEFVGEARTRINNAIGYQVTFRAKRGVRTLYGRHLLLVEDQPDGLRRGVIIELTSTATAGTPNATEIGNHGALKTPLRSFRFGADRTGGTA